MSRTFPQSCRVSELSTHGALERLRRKRSTRRYCGDEVKGCWIRGRGGLPEVFWTEKVGLGDELDAVGSVK